MKQISIVVAASDNQVIGIENKLPWHLPADLKFFKNLTIGHAIIMGRKTFESIGKALPNRRNLVITRDRYFAAEGCELFHSLEEAIDACVEGETFIIGGDSIYKQALSLCNKIYLTRVHTHIENGQAFFPELNATVWSLISSEFVPKDDRNLFDMHFEVYERAV